jgi:hypothetical protein
MTMARFIEVRRRCMGLADWPEADQRAWAIATRNTSVFDRKGRAARWAPSTIETTVAGYGRWLHWLQELGLLCGTGTPASRVTPARVVEFIDFLKTMNASSTVQSRVLHLCMMLRAMYPSHDWDWLQIVANNTGRGDPPARDKRNLIVMSDRLFAYGIELMDAAEKNFGASRFRQAADHRDGLLIACLAARPLRLANFAAIEIGNQLVKRGDIYWLEFEGSATKTGQPIEEPLPEFLTPYIDRHIAYHRPILFMQNRPHSSVSSRPMQNHQFLWVSIWGTPMAKATIYECVVALTGKKFGHALSPHLFRDCAATSVAIKDPKHVRITMCLLNHTSLATSEKYYNQARSLEAADAYQNHVRKFSKKQSHSDAGVQNE